MDELKEFFEENKKLIIISVVSLTIFLVVLGGALYIFSPSKEVAGYGDGQNDRETTVEATHQTKNSNQGQGHKANDISESEISKLEREIEKNKPKFDMNISPLYSYETHKKMKLEKVDVNDFSPESKVFNATTQLLDEDIKRLKSYEVSNAKGLHIGFDEYYKKKRKHAQAWCKMIKPSSFPTMKGAYVEWISSPRLIYRDLSGENHIRGILRIKYLRDDNRFGLKANKHYEIDTDITFTYTLNKNGTKSKNLHYIKYLSRPREVNINE